MSHASAVIQNQSTRTGCADASKKAMITRVGMAENDRLKSWKCSAKSWRPKRQPLLGIVVSNFSFRSTYSDSYLPTRALYSASNLRGGTRQAPRRSQLTWKLTSGRCSRHGQVGLVWSPCRAIVQPHPILDACISTGAR